MLIHPLAERLRGLGMAAMADAFLEMQTNSSSVSGHHKLHRSYGSDQAHDGEFGKAVGILHLQILDPQTVRFHRTEHLLDIP